LEIVDSSIKNCRTGTYGAALRTRHLRRRVENTAPNLLQLMALRSF
jgi:hypothetical protein